MIKPFNLSTFNMPSLKFSGDKASIPPVSAQPEEPQAGRSAKDAEVAAQLAALERKYEGCPGAAAFFADLACHPGIVADVFTMPGSR